MTALADLVEPLKRELAVPGVFEDTFPDTSDEELAATLADGFAEAQLMGFFPDMTLGTAPAYETSAPLSLPAGSLVVLFASSRVLRAWLRSLSTGERYKAGPVEYETTRAANLLRDELATINNRLQAVITDARRAGRGAVSVSVLDNYWARMPAMRFHGYELGR